MVRIEIEGVTKRFGGVTAVDGLSLDIPAGTFTALLGPSGCGKTTTMNMISGLETPTQGEIRFAGRRVNELPPAKRNVGFVFQHYAIFTRMTAFDNIAFGLRVRKRPKAEIDAAVRRIADLLDIVPLLPRRTTELSVNDLQKVAIGRSMIVQPDIFLLDEPFSNLDAAFRSYMRAELKKLQRELGQTMVYVTHDQVEAMSMAERIAIMDSGKLQQYGSPDEVYNHPANLFVARFVGSTPMNFLPATIDSRDGTDGTAVVRALVPGSRPIPLMARRRLPDGGLAFTMGFRPEHVLLVDAIGDGPDLRGTVDLVEPLGPRNVVHLRIGDFTVRASIPASMRPQIGEVLGLVLSRERIHVFEEATGQALR